MADVEKQASIQVRWSQIAAGVLVLLRTVFLLFLLLPWLGHFVVLIFPLKNNDYYYSVYLIYILLQLNYCIKCFQDFLNPFWLVSSCICRVTPAASCVSNTHTHHPATSGSQVIFKCLNLLTVATNDFKPAINSFCPGVAGCFCFYSLQKPDRAAICMRTHTQTHTLWCCIQPKNELLCFKLLNRCSVSWDISRLPYETCFYAVELHVSMQTTELCMFI